MVFMEWPGISVPVQLPESIQIKRASLRSAAAYLKRRRETRVLTALTQFMWKRCQSRFQTDGRQPSRDPPRAPA